VRERARQMPRSPNRSLRVCTRARPTRGNLGTPEGVGWFQSRPVVREKLTGARVGCGSASRVRADLPGEILGGGRVCGEIESTEHAPSIGPGFDFIFVISYPTTPARGVTSWSGVYQADFIPPRLTVLHGRETETGN
jgi:hypothetical protein